MNCKLLVFFLLLMCADNAFCQYKAQGKASFYGNEFNGRKTASGEKFSNKKFTAAHKTLPFGTRVKVTNLSNNKWCIVTINDRGPFIKGRIIDLSKVAADSLDYLHSGVCEVLVEEISFEEEAMLLAGKDTFISKRFPEQWVGKWKGDINRFNEQGFETRGVLELTISRIDSNTYSWSMIFSKVYARKHDYELVIQNADSNQFYFKNWNGLKISVRKFGNTIIARDDVMGTYYNYIFTLNNDEILYQLAISDIKDNDNNVIHNFEIATLKCIK